MFGASFHFLTSDTVEIVETDAVDTVESAADASTIESTHRNRLASLTNTTSSPRRIHFLSYSHARARHRFGMQVANLGIAFARQREGHAAQSKAEYAACPGIEERKRHQPAAHLLRHEGPERSGEFHVLSLRSQGRDVAKLDVSITGQRGGTRNGADAHQVAGGTKKESATDQPSTKTSHRLLLYRAARRAARFGAEHSRAQRRSRSSRGEKRRVRRPSANRRFISCSTAFVGEDAHRRRLWRLEQPIKPVH